MYICKKCKREFKSKASLTTHNGWHTKIFTGNTKFSEEHKKNLSKSHKGQIPWNKGVNMKEDIKKKIAETRTGQKWTDEQRKKHSIAMIKAVKNNPESYSANNICGRTKIIEYNGFNLNGKWELEVAKWLDKKGIKWTNKLKKGIEYYWNGALHLYFLDFYLPERNLYIEVKGYERERDHCKWNSLDNLLVIKKKEIEEIKNDKFN